MSTSAQVALSYVADMTLDAFLVDMKTQDAVLWRIALIGEAANRVGAGTREALALPWSQIIGMRHVAIHHYVKLDMPRVWSTVHDRLPELVTQVDDFLRALP